MIKWEREDGKVLEFDVKNTVKFYANGEYIGNIQYLYPLRADGNRILEFKNTKAKNQIFKLKVTDERVAREILAKVEENKAMIDNFFKNLDNVKLEKLSNGSIAISEKTDEYKSTKALDEDYFYEIEKNWIRENEKYFTEDKGFNQDEFGMMHSYTNYFYTKENVAKIDNETEEYKKTNEYKEKMDKKQEGERRFNELCKLAEKTTDVDFEDMTGLLREHYII